MEKIWIRSLRIELFSDCSHEFYWLSWKIGDPPPVQNIMPTWSWGWKLFSAGKYLSTTRDRHQNFSTWSQSKNVLKFPEQDFRLERNLTQNFTVDQKFGRFEIVTPKLFSEVSKTISWESFLPKINPTSQSKDVLNLVIPCYEYS